MKIKSLPEEERPVAVGRTLHICTVEQSGLCCRICGLL